MTLLADPQPATPGVTALSLDLLTTAQVARRLNLVRWTICRAVAAGDLVPATKLPGVNGAYLFTEEAVAAWRSRGERLAGL